MIIGLVIISVVVILIYSYVKVDKQEAVCKKKYDDLQECLMKRYEVAERLTTYVAQSVIHYQKPMTGDLKTLRKSNRVRFYEIEHIEKYLTDAILMTMDVVEKESDEVKGDQYRHILREIQESEKTIYYTLIECNYQREQYNEKLHTFPIILFARFYGYQDKEKLEIPLATYPEKK